MTRTIRHTLTAGLFSSAMLFTGCAGANIPGLPGGLPGDTPSNNPTSPMPVSASDCTRDKPAADPVKGGPALGKYNGQTLPAGYDKAYSSEAQVTEAIKKEDGGANWACFQKFYPGAVTVYTQIKNAAPAASPSPAAN
ncbi:MAG: hypothetical protein VKQ33_08440 [Candidatus Sericytochromatia bacterium]|nr:hypothetical protein [Candidatus Sericytochromatia bacterium]